MSEPFLPFIELAVDGRVNIVEIDDFVDRWHDERGGRQLHDYLGLTTAEYALWLVEPAMLDAIVKARASGRPLSAVVRDMLESGRESSAPAADPRTARLGQWLAEQAAPR